MVRTLASWLLLFISALGLNPAIRLWMLASKNARRMRMDGRNGGALLAYEFLRRDGCHRATNSVIGCAIAIAVLVWLPELPSTVQLVLLDDAARTAVEQSKVVRLFIGLCIFALLGLNSYGAVQSLKDKRKAELIEHLEYDRPR